MTASKPKTPTASGISRLLAAAGFERAVIAIRGGRAGFSVTKGAGETVRVEFYANTGFCSVKRRTETLDRYASAIADAGYGYRYDVDVDRLIVTAKTED